MMALELSARTSVAGSNPTIMIIRHGKFHFVHFVCHFLPGFVKKLIADFIVIYKEK
jgi:hypothetical protein